MLRLVFIRLKYNIDYRLMLQYGWMIISHSGRHSAALSTASQIFKENEISLWSSSSEKAMKQNLPEMFNITKNVAWSLKCTLNGVKENAYK